MKFLNNINNFFIVYCDAQKYCHEYNSQMAWGPLDRLYFFTQIMFIIIIVITLFSWLLLRSCNFYKNSLKFTQNIKFNKILIPFLICFLTYFILNYYDIVACQNNLSTINLYEVGLLEKNNSVNTNENEEQNSKTPLTNVKNIEKSNHWTENTSTGVTLFILVIIFFCARDKVLIYKLFSEKEEPVVVVNMRVSTTSTVEKRIDPNATPKVDLPSAQCQLSSLKSFSKFHTDLQLKNKENESLSVLNKKK